MLHAPTVEKLQALHLRGLVAAWEEQSRQPAYAELGFEERLGLLVDAEWTWRENRRQAQRLKAARLKCAACVEDIDYRQPRGLDKSVLRSLATCQWIAGHQNVICVGPTGTGKTFLACALATQACRHGYTARTPGRPLPGAPRPRPPGHSVADGHVAPRQQRPAHVPLCPVPRLVRPPVGAWGPAGPPGRSLPGRVAPGGVGSDQVLAGRSPGAVPGPRPVRPARQGPLADRAGLPGTQRRAGARPLRGPFLHRLAPPCHPGRHRVRVPHPGAAPQQKKLRDGACPRFGSGSNACSSSWLSGVPGVDLG